MLFRSGISRKVLDRVAQYTGLDFEYIDTNDFSEAQELLINGKVDILSAISHDFVWSQKNNVYLSGIYLNTNVMRIIKNGSYDITGTIALPRNYYASDILARRFVNNRIIYFDSLLECLLAVKNGEADVTYANNYVANYHLSNANLYELQFAGSIDIQENLAMGISKKNEPILIDIINKGLRSISNQDINNAVLEYSILRKPLTFKEIVYAYPLEIIFTTIILLGTILIAVCVVFFAHKKHMITIKKEAEYDFLTKLNNRRSVEAIINQELTKNDHKNLGAFFILDIDNFKQINDKYGHNEGDLLLQTYAEIIKTTARKNPVGRIGGDEFVI